LKYGAGGEESPRARAPAWQIGGGGGWIGERKKRGDERGGSESILVHIVTTWHPVPACQTVATLGMPYISSTHAIVARLPLHVLKHACTLRNTHAYVDSLVQLTFMRKLKQVCSCKPAQGA